MKVTEQHYTGYVERFKPADPETIPARWATGPVVAGLPQLRIVGATAN